MDSLIDILAANQLIDEHCVQRRLSFEVERIQSFVSREFGGFQSPFGSTAFSCNQLKFTQLQQIVEMFEIICCIANRIFLAFTE